MYNTKFLKKSNLLKKTHLTQIDIDREREKKNIIRIYFYKLNHRVDQIFLTNKICIFFEMQFNTKMHFLIATQ